MMKSKKQKILFSATSLLVLSLIVISTTGIGDGEKASAVSKDVKKTTPAYVVSQGHGITYENFGELDMDTELVVKGKKLNEEKVLLTKDEQGLATDNRTLSGFWVEKVLKNEGDLNVKEGETITVQENAALDGNIVISSLGYQLMNNDEEYLLFLRPNLTESGVYNIRGVYYGKVPTQEVQGLTSQADLQFKGDQEEQAKLQTIFQDALDKYNNN
ncbi:hypothetical protein [Paenibacillus jiagnxiensis]|uniref:hypothetical protein n=1 Tax=Paenibacillus jiagnxiensis TaxID=3228926 RepID=UPI00339E9664